MSRKQKKEGNNNKKGNRFVKFFLVFNGIIFSITTITVIGVGVVGLKIYKDNEVQIQQSIRNGYEKVNNIDETTFNNRIPTVILDKNGNVLKEFKTVEYEYQKYSEINPNVFKALVAVEDVRFYEHKGVDLQGLLRAFYSTLVKKDVQGGSTITQQLAKNIFLTMDKTIWRKLEEMVIAQELEKKYSKQQILEYYVNNVNFGNGCYSIESASKYYFGKETEELSLSEIALLIGIPNNPTKYNPIKNLDNAIERRNLILDRMVTAEMISETYAQSEKNKEIILNVQDKSFDNSISGNYALDYAVQKATESLMKQNGFKFRYEFSNDDERKEYFEMYNEFYSESREELISGGYKVETTIDMQLQEDLQKVVDQKMKSFKKKQENGLYLKQASATVIDNRTGEVIAIVGGRSQEGNDYNRASLGARQPGSAIKPLVSYIQAFENGYTPNSLYEDKAIDNGPSNWYKTYKGMISLRYAVEISTNTIPYRLNKELGTKECMSDLANMNFKYLTANDFTYPIVAVGGFTRGATTVEMASAYSTIARNGSFIEPTNISKITKIGTEDIVYQNTYFQKRIFDAGASYMMTDVLKGVINEEHGTGKNYKLSNYPYQAGKTGTTNDNKDYWFCGYTPYYTMSVWVGDDTPTAQTSSSKVAGDIWKDFMEQIHKDKEHIDFIKPVNIVENDNGNLINNKKTEEEILKERENLEYKRTQDEIKEQKERLENEDYRIIHGISKEEEERRESLAEITLNNISNYNLTSLEQENEIKEMFDNAKSVIEDVKRSKAKQDFLNKYTLLKYDFENQLTYLKAEEERKKQEELERLEQERLEQELLENINNNNLEENDTSLIEGTQDEIFDNPIQEESENDENIDDNLIDENNFNIIIPNENEVIEIENNSVTE